MAVGRYYKVGVFDTSTPLATGAAVATTTPTPILYGLTATTIADCNISAVRVSCMGAASFPANASFVASLNITTTGPAGGQTAVSRNLTYSAGLISQTTFKTAGGTSGTPITGMTLSTELWAQNLPFTAGANWGEWFTPGFEINIPTTTQFALYITCSSAGTATTFAGEIEFSE